MFCLVAFFLDYHQHSSVIPHALVPCIVLQVEMLKIQDLITYQEKFVELNSYTISTLWNHTLRV